MTLDDLEKLCEAATRGPWSPHGDYVVRDGMKPGETFIQGICDRTTASDAEFIAASRTLLPKLLRVARAAERLHRQMAGIERRAIGEVTEDNLARMVMAIKELEAEG